MSRRDIIANDSLTDNIVTLSLSASWTRGFAGLKLHINMARGLRCPLVKFKSFLHYGQCMAPKNNSVVKTGLVPFPAGQTKIRRRMRMKLNLKEILNGELLFRRVKKIAAATKLGRSEMPYPLAQSSLLERFCRSILPTMCRFSILR